MPILKDFRETKTISLPSFPDSKVEIYDSLLVGEMQTINFEAGNELLMTIEAIPKLIKSWNFTNEAGETLEINKENLGFLKLDDLQYLGEQIVAFNNENKKKVNSSQQSQ